MVNGSAFTEFPPECRRAPTELDLALKRPSSRSMTAQRGLGSAASAVEWQSQSRPRPATFQESPGAGAGHPCIPHVGSAETDIRRDRVGKRDEFISATRLEDRDAAIPERAYADPAALLHRQ